jgi:uncharacterized NAD(P)/FAD-binding protein YdhS
VQLLDSPGPPTRLLLVERSGKTGRGVAFSTELLNVPAASMSALERDPGHFVRWLGAKGSPNAQDDFVPRHLFGQYLGETLLSWAHLHQDDLVEIARDEVVDVDAARGGATLVFSGRQPVSVDAVVLATGILPPRCCKTTSAAFRTHGNPAYSTRSAPQIPSHCSGQALRRSTCYSRWPRRATTGASVRFPVTGCYRELT